MHSADATTIGTQGRFGTVHDRVVAVGTRGRFLHLGSGPHFQVNMAVDNRQAGVKADNRQAVLEVDNREVTLIR